MRNRRIHLLLLIVAVAVFSGCDLIYPKLAKTGKKPAAGPPAGETVVAKVGGSYITQKDLNREIEVYNDLVTRQGLPADAKLDTKEKKVDYLKNQMVRRYVLYQAALDRELDKQESVSRLLDQSRINLLVGELANKEVEKVSVSSKEVEEWYGQNKERLKGPEQRKISEIVTATEPEAKKVLIELLNNGNFAELAKQYSKGKTASSGGDLGYLVNEEGLAKMAKFEAFYKEAFASSLAAGGISRIFSGPDGSYIIRVEDIKKADAPALNEIWDDIKGLILSQKQEAVVDELVNSTSKKTEIQIFESKVE